MSRKWAARSILRWSTGRCTAKDGAKSRHAPSLRRQAKKRAERLKKVTRPRPGPDSRAGCSVRSRPAGAGEVVCQPGVCQHGCRRGATHHGFEGFGREYGAGGFLNRFRMDQKCSVECALV